MGYLTHEHVVAAFLAAAWFSVWSGYSLAVAIGTYRALFVRKSGISRGQAAVVAGVFCALTASIGTMIFEIVFVFHPVSLSWFWSAAATMALILGFVRAMYLIEIRKSELHWMPGLLKKGLKMCLDDIYGRRSWGIT